MAYAAEDGCPGADISLASAGRDAIANERAPSKNERLDVGAADGTAAEAVVRRQLVECFDGKRRSSRLRRADATPSATMRVYPRRRVPDQRM